VNLILCLLFTLSPTDLYNQANAHYESGNYQKAIDQYEEAAQHTSNANLYYNLANAYFKIGRIGKAILNYRRAQFLAPRDGDINHNLEFARNYRIDKIQITQSPMTKLLSNIFHCFSMYETQILTAIFFIISAILISLYIIYRRNIFAYTTIISAVLCTIFFITWQVWQSEKTARHAVITTSETSALSGPGEDYKEILVIHYGTEIKIRESRGDYALIQLPGGIGGWITTESLEEIF